MSDYDDFEEEDVAGDGSPRDSQGTRSVSDHYSSASSAQRRSRTSNRRRSRRTSSRSFSHSSSGSSSRSAAGSSAGSTRTRSRSPSQSLTANRHRGSRLGSTDKTVPKPPSHAVDVADTKEGTAPRRTSKVTGPPAPVSSTTTAAVQAQEADFDLFARTTFIAQHLAAVLPTAGEDVVTQVRAFQDAQHTRLQAELRRWEEERQDAHQRLQAEQRKREAEREARRLEAAEQRRRWEAEWQQRRSVADREREARQAALQEERRRQLTAAEEGRKSVIALAKLQAMVKQHSHGLELCAAESAALDISLGLLASPSALEAVAEGVMPPLPPSPIPSVAYQLCVSGAVRGEPNTDNVLPPLPISPFPHLLLPTPAAAVSPSTFSPTPTPTHEPPPLSARRGGSSHIARIAQRRDMVAMPAEGAAVLLEDGGSHSIPLPSVEWMAPSENGAPTTPPQASPADPSPGGRCLEVEAPRADVAKEGDTTIDPLASVADPPAIPPAPPLLAVPSPSPGAPPALPTTVTAAAVPPASTPQPATGQTLPTGGGSLVAADAASQLLSSLPVDLSPLSPLPPIVETFAHLPLPTLPPLCVGGAEVKANDHPPRSGRGTASEEDIAGAVAAAREALAFRFRTELQALRWQMADLRQEVQSKLSAGSQWQAQERERLLLTLAAYHHTQEREVLTAQLMAAEAAEAAAAGCRAKDEEVELAMGELQARKATSQAESRLHLLEAQVVEGRAAIVAEQAAVLWAIVAATQQAMGACDRLQLGSQRDALQAEAQHHTQWQAALEARQGELETRHAAAAAKEKELEAAAIQWQLQLQEVGLRLDHLRLQQQQAEHQQEEQRVEESRAQLELQEKRQQLFQQESEWQSQTAALRQQLDAQSAGMAEVEKRLQRQEIALQQQHLSLRTRLADVAEREQQLDQQELRLQELEAAFHARSELLTADVARQKRQVAEAWEQLQRKSVEVADHIGALNHLLVVSHSPLVDASISQLSSSLKHGGCKAADAAADEMAASAMITTADTTPSKPPSLFLTPTVSPSNVDMYTAFQAGGSVPSWSLCPTPLE
eukprot:GGOE01017776.1.p1 GENE.GGOE01017776.1~~GGOE01017776.1.p1  ORF type:complete len:1062 (+),score=315.88 GGOE01017776.1:160-3345(+)